MNDFGEPVSTRADCHFPFIEILMKGLQTVEVLTELLSAETAPLISLNDEIHKEPGIGTLCCHTWRGTNKGLSLY